MIDDARGDPNNIRAHKHRHTDNSAKMLDCWTTAQVDTWMKTIKMPVEAASIFREHTITGKVILAGLTVDDLADMGIAKPYRAFIMSAMEKLVGDYEEASDASTVVADLEDGDLEMMEDLEDMMDQMKIDNSVPVHVK